MAEQEMIERLDEAIDALLSDRREAPADRELAGLLKIAGVLRDLPDPKFKSQLKWTVVPRIQPTMQLHFLVRGVPEFIGFLENAFGGSEEFRATAPDGKVLHARVRIGDSIVEMGDASGDYEPYAFGVHLYVDDADAMYERALAAGATSLRAPADQFYGDREATVKDPFGNQWYIASPVRAGFRTITAFLHPRGTDRMLTFVEQAFGATVLGDPYRTPDGLIAHAAVQIGNSLLEMGETHGQWAPMAAGIHLYVDNADAVYQQAVRAGAKTVYPPYDAPYGERSAYVVDPFGNHWYIGTPK